MNLRNEGGKDRLETWQQIHKNNLTPKIQGYRLKQMEGQVN